MPQVLEKDPKVDQEFTTLEKVIKKQLNNRVQSVFPERTAQ